MLVLTRKRNESVRVSIGGKELTLTVNRIKGDSVRLAFDAPREVQILRTELPVLLTAPAITPDILSKSSERGFKETL
jgi:carbon storage regulator CsrA